MQSGSAGSVASPWRERSVSTQTHGTGPFFLLKQTTHVGGSQFLGQEWENTVNQWSWLVDRWATFPWLNTQRVGDTQSCSCLISWPVLTSSLFCQLTTLYSFFLPQRPTMVNSGTFLYWFNAASLFTTNVYSLIQTQCKKDLIYRLLFHHP